ncbi:MAG TPA: cyanophycin synthetase, partial [Candidatus Binatia bacterium]
VLDDYGHHPAEIQATVSALLDGWSRPLTVIFQPHRFSRTRDLFNDFLTAFDGVQRLVLTDIYGAGEDEIPGVSAEALYGAIKRRGRVAVDYIADKEAIAERLAPVLKAGDLVLTLGAGDIYRVGEELVERLER